MKTKDRLKEEIGMNKLLITILSALNISFFTWIWSNSENFVKAEGITLYCTNALLAIAMIFI